MNTLNFDIHFRGIIEHKGAKFSLYADGARNELHLLDFDIPGARTLTNAIDEIFIKSLAAQMKYKQDFKMDIEDFRIYLYHTDGYTTQWSKTDGFKYIGLDHPDLLPIFRDQMEPRKAEFL